MSLRIENGRIIDPANKIDRVGTLIIDNGKVVAIEDSKKASGGFDATGMIVMPGGIDMHVHFREPGQEYKEDIESGSKAAVAGGFTACACMPNTDPINDNPSITESIIKRAVEVGLIRLYPIAAVSKESKGEVLTEFSALRRAGAIAFSDDGVPVRSAQLMRRALEYAGQFAMPILNHCEMLDLTHGAVMHEGEVSAMLGLKGIPAVAESLMVHRDIELARLTKSRVHLCHLSNAGSVKLLRNALAEGVAVSGEVTPHHLWLDHTAVNSLDTCYKMKPPLTAPEDITALRQGWCDGTIAVSATDHAPHADFEKAGVFDHAPFGILGLQTALPLTFELAESLKMPLSAWVASWTINPAKILNLPLGTLSVGAAADVTIFDPKAKVTHTADHIRSKSRNTPFLGRPLHGQVVATWLAGREVFSR